MGRPHVTCDDVPLFFQKERGEGEKQLLENKNRRGTGWLKTGLVVLFEIFKVLTLTGTLIAIWKKNENVIDQLIGSI